MRRAWPSVSGHWGRQSATRLGRPGPCAGQGIVAGRGPGDPRLWPVHPPLRLRQFAQTAEGLRGPRRGAIATDLSRVSAEHARSAYTLQGSQGHAVVVRHTMRKYPLIGVQVPVHLTEGWGWADEEAALQRRHALSTGRPVRYIGPGGHKDAAWAGGGGRA